MVLILDGTSEVGAPVRSNLCYFICLRHLIKSRAVTNQIFFSSKTFFLHACAKRSKLPSNIYYHRLCLDRVRLGMQSNMNFIVVKTRKHLTDRKTDKLKNRQTNYQTEKKGKVYEIRQQYLYPNSIWGVVHDQQKKELFLRLPLVITNT